MYNLINLVNTITRGENMKKAIEFMMIGAGVGISMVKLYDGLKSGEIDKVVTNGKKEINKVMNSMK